MPADSVLLHDDRVMPCVRELGDIVQLCLEDDPSQPLTFANGWSMGTIHIGVDACILEREELVALGTPEKAEVELRSPELNWLWLGALAGAIHEAEELTEIAKDDGYDHTGEECVLCERVYPGWNDLVQHREPARALPSRD